MITRDEADRLRDQLLTVLEEDAHNTERLLWRLDAITKETGVGAHAALLLILTRMPFEDEEARNHWRSILAHRTTMSNRLGRDVGLRVSLLDFFMNVNRRLVHPTLIDLRLLESSGSSGATDPLTGLANDRRFRSSLQTELRRARRYRQSVAVVLFDLDDFGPVNASVGNLVADRILRESAILLHNKIRDIDLAARPGEDELALVLPQTDRDGALVVAERFRKEVEGHFSRREVAGRLLGLTISGGIAEYPGDATSPESLVERAAQALYRAKASGKNAIHVFHAERRRFLRFDLEPGKFEVEVLAPKESGRARLGNLSRNGVLFECPEALEVGEEIEVRLVEAPEEGGPSTARIRGKVVRLEQISVEGPEGSGSEPWYDVGVAFDLEAPGGEQSVIDFLQRVRSRGMSPLS